MFIFDRSQSLSTSKLTPQKPYMHGQSQKRDHASTWWAKNNMTWERRRRTATSEKQRRQQNDKVLSEMANTGRSWK